MSALSLAFAQEGTHRLKSQSNEKISLYMACFAVVWIKWSLQRDVAWPIRDTKKVLPLAFAEFGQRFEESFETYSLAEGNRKADRKIKAGKHLSIFYIESFDEFP